MYACSNFSFAPGVKKIYKTGVKDYNSGAKPVLHHTLHLNSFIFTPV